MEVPRAATTSSSAGTSNPDHKPPRQIKSKQKSRSGCQTCKLRRLKCDETKPQCRNCIKKGQECPGYQVRLQWSTKYERPRESTRSEPSNFDQLVSAVTQTIVPVPHSPASGPDTTPDNKPAPSPSISSISTGELKWRVSKTKASDGLPSTGTAVPPVHLLNPTVLSISSLPITNPGRDFLDLGQPEYSYHVDIKPFIDVQSGNIMANTIGDASISTSGELLWKQSPRSSPGATGFDSLITLASSEDVDEPESSLCGSETDIPLPPVQTVTRFGQLLPPAPQLSRSLVDIPSFLIQHWFKSVCSAWSAFDNKNNPYRQLSASLCQSSSAVYYALQSMAAASLVEHLPHLKEVARSAPRLAAGAIRQELQSFSIASKSKAGLSFPGGLVLSLFCMSSSICWTDHKQLGLQFLTPGRHVLNFLNQRANYLTPEDRQLLNFFNGCLVYEEMLRTIVSNDQKDMGSLAAWQPSSSQPISVVPHAWTGVSPDLLRLFGKTMFFCRRSLDRWRGEGSIDDKMFRESMDYQEAATIEAVLLATEIPEIPGTQEMTEEATLKRHLHDAAEAYRLSSLLQLYMTFPVLMARRAPTQLGFNDLAPYGGWISSLALRVTYILRNIPPSSSMRCLQPLLCLCAGTGLRYDNITPVAQAATNTYADPFELGLPNTSLNPVGFMASPQFGFPPVSTCVIGENDLEIASARRFLNERLSRLEQNLPPKPIQVEKHLLKVIWATYDEEAGTTCKTHWLDVMINNNLESIFG